MQTREQRKKWCDEMRQQIWAGRQATFESLDRYILTLSSGALALSISFLRDIFPIGPLLWQFALLGSWMAFTLAILVTIFSHILSQFAHDKQLDILEEYRKAEDSPLGENKYSKWTMRANYLAVTSFTIGVLFTLIFVWINTINRMGA